MRRAWWVLGLLLPLGASAEVERELREAVTALARSSYTWETTVRQRFRGENVAPRLELNSPAEIRGQVAGNGVMQITLLPTRDVPVPVVVVFREGDVAARTPSGWLRRAELRRPAGTDRDVVFEGKPVRPSRVAAVALKGTAMRPLTEELIDLIAEIKTCRMEQGLILAELRDGAVEQRWGDAQAKRAPEIQGTVIFKLTPDGLAEFHVVLAIGFPDSRTKKIAWSMQQWSTRITAIGATSVEIPDDALAALDRLGSEAAERN